MTGARDTVFWAVVLAALVALTQLGSLTQEIINWDENTFMLLAGDLLDGTLPFTEKFDNKPPMIFFLLAGWMALFGDSVQSVRLFGDVCLWGTALMVFVIARSYAGSLAAGAGAALCVAIHGVDPGFHTTAGLPAMLVLMVALWLILTRREAAWAMVLAGILVSIAVLTRSNLAYVALTSGIWLLILGLWVPAASRCTWRTPVWYAVGGIIPLALMILTYAQADAVGDLRLASVDVALSYSDQYGWMGAAVGHVRAWITAITVTPLVHIPFTLTTAWAVVLLLWPGRVPDAQTISRYDWSIIWVFLLATLFSIAKSGAVYPYYWQQFFPLTCLIVAFLIHRLDGAWLRGVALGGVALACVGALMPNAADSVRVMTTPGYAQDGYEVQKAADFLGPRLRTGDRVWALDRHLILHYLDWPVVSPVLAHPSNITRGAILAPLVESGYLPPEPLQRVMESRPEYLVSNGHDDLFYFRLRSSVDIRAYVVENYDLIYDTPIVTIWQRKGYAPGS